jgi:hypothetical protein
MDLALCGNCVASDIHHFAVNCAARARCRVYRNSLRLQLCVLGALRRLRPARWEKIVRLSECFRLGVLVP